MTNTVRFYSSLPILSFPEPAIARHQSLKRQKINIGKSDLRIAAIALDQSDVVVTRNTKDFQRVPGLRIEDWTI
jgi:tRNA(fMet)-specific endonuclease VapC